MVKRVKIYFPDECIILAQFDQLLINSTVSIPRHPNLHGQKDTEPNEMHGIEIHGAESAHRKWFTDLAPCLLIPCIWVRVVWRRENALRVFHGSVYFMVPCTLLVYHNLVKNSIFKLLTLMVPDLLSRQ